MGKYKNLQDDIFSVFGGASWEAENIKTYPSDFIAIDPGDEFIRVMIIPNGEGVNLLSVTGVVIIDIFTSAGKGPTRASLIADKLDNYLVRQTLSTVSNSCTQFPLGSALASEGRDKDNGALYRSVYSIPFKYFGVS